MLNVVIPLPIAVALLAALTFAVTAYRSAHVIRTAPPVRQPAPTGRHRLDAAATPYRPRTWSADARELAAA